MIYLVYLLAALVLLPLVLPYVLGPFIVKMSRPIPEWPGFEVIPADDVGDLPDELRSHFLASSTAMTDLGFKPLLFLMQSEQIQNVTMFLVLFRHGRARDYGVSMVAIGGRSSEAEKVQARTMAFSTWLSDGRMVETSDSDDPGSFPQAPFKAIAKLPGLAAGDLYGAHRARLRHLANGVETLDMAEPGGEVEALVASMRGELLFAVDKGFYVLGPEGFQPSWKGAFLMTWGLCWPVVSLRKYRLKRRAARVLAALNLGALWKGPK